MKPYIQNNIPEEYKNKEFTGYKWISDRPIPDFVNGKFILPDIGLNPFVREANLYAKDGSISISIEHIDGKYLVCIVSLDGIEDAIVLEEQSYLTHRLKEHSKICFVRAWIPIEEPECEGMEVLQSAWRAFVGFDKLPQKIEEIVNKHKD